MELSITFTQRQQMIKYLFLIPFITFAQVDSAYIAKKQKNLSEDYQQRLKWFEENDPSLNEIRGAFKMLELIKAEQDSTKVK